MSYFVGMVLYMAHLLSTCLQEDAARQLEILEKEIQDSTAELGKIIPLHV